MMGALTSKLYAYKARPWEVSSVETVSIQDPFFTLIKVETRDRNVLRILPVIGTEEWIEDTTRFFISAKPLTSILAKYPSNTEYVIEGFTYKSDIISHEKLTLREAITTLIGQITKQKDLTVVIDDKCDAQTIAIIRKLDNLRKKINITLTSATARRAYTNSYDDFQIDETDNVFFIKESMSLKSLFQTKLINYRQIPLEDMSITEFNINELLRVMEGYIPFSTAPRFVIPYSLTRIIPATFKRFIIDVTNQASLISTQEKPFFAKKGGNYLSLDANLLVSENISKNNSFFALTHEFRHKIGKILIGTHSNLFAQNQYADLFGNPIFSTSTVPMAFLTKHVFSYFLLYFKKSVK